MMGKLVPVIITASNAIYVDDTRITDRSTKPWGGSATIDGFDCRQDEVVKKCLERGHSYPVSRIDAEPYLSQVTK